MSDLLNKYNDLESKVKKVLQEQPRLEAERDMLKRDITKKMGELKELGVNFKDREDLEKEYENLSKSLEISLDSLDRKLNEYDYIKKDLDEMKINNKDEEVMF